LVEFVPFTNQAPAPPLGITVLVKVPTEAGPGKTVSAMLGATSPIASTVVVVHVTTWPAALQVQFVPTPETKLSPVCNVSVSVIVPLVAAEPVFDTPIVQTPLVPSVKFPLCVFDATSRGPLSTCVVVLAVAAVPDPVPGNAMLTVLLRLGNAEAPTKTTRLTGGAEPPAGIAVGVVQVTVWPAAPHVQPVPLAETYVKPLARSSVMVTVPFVGWTPEFLAVSTYVPSCPTTKSLPTIPFVPAAVGELVTITVESVAVDAEAAPPPDAVALFVTVPAGPTTLTTSEIDGDVAALAIAVVVVHVTTWPAAEQFQPVPVADANVKPVGRVSVSVSVPDVGEVPLFVTLSVYVPVAPITKFPVCEPFAVSAGAPFTVVGSVAVGEFEAPPPVALAVLVTLGYAVAITLTVSVIELPAEAAAIAVVEVQVTAWPLAAHVQPVPVAEL